MKFNKKGWGTMEMLLLSAGILVALLVAVYFISKLYGSFDNSIKNRQYADLETKLASAAKKYVLDNNIYVNNELIISSDTLEVLGYINYFVDNNNYPCTGYVKVVKADLVNTYKSYINCQNYSTKNVNK